ncbi:MAG: hypothetical protein WCP33_04730, partial [Deltaproteobacteria bacterium]
MSIHINWRSLLVLLAIMSFPYLSIAGGLPEVISHTAQYLERSISVNIKWQSENPVTKVKVIAGKGENEVAVDEYDNRRNPSGYSGEVSVVVPVDPALFQDSISYQIQLQDDLRQKSTLYSGNVVQPVVTGTAVVMAPGIAPPPPPPGMPGVQPQPGVAGVGMVVPPPVAIGAAPATGEDGWGKENIRAGKGQGQTGDGKSRDIVDKLLAVAERFDTPPSLDVIKVNILGPENVSFTSKANDDKGLREIIFKVYDGTGNKVGEQKLSNLGKKWEGSTEPVKVTNGGAYRVVAQATDTGGNTSKEQTANFIMKGTPPPTTLAVTLLSQEAVTSGAQWQIDGGEWQVSAATFTTTIGKHKLTFKDVTGWVTPVAQDIEIKEGVNTATATYIVPAPKIGTLTVTILPTEAAKAGAQWMFDGGGPQGDGTTVTSPVGKHSVTFKEVAGWTTPIAQDVTIAEGANKASATYTAQNGTLTVSIVPAAAASAGAQWRVGGGDWQNSGSSIKVPAGNTSV